MCSVSVVVGPGYLKDLNELIAHLMRSGFDHMAMQ